MGTRPESPPETIMAWTVSCRNPKYQNLAQSILASTTFLSKHYQNREKVG